MDIKIYGILGFPLEHSFSPYWFNAMFKRDRLENKCKYKKFEEPLSENIPNVLRTENLVGLNITIPYKQAILPYLTQISDVAKAVGAVNVVHKIRENTWAGYNTDVIGFELSLKRFLGIEPNEDSPNWHGRALVCGNGGASAAIQYVLNQLKIPFDIGVRKIKAEDEFNLKAENIYTYDSLPAKGGLKDYKLCINTTPIGTFPNVNDILPLPYETIPSEFFFFDLVYNPEYTQMSNIFYSYGAKICNGLEMLNLQAKASWEIWQR